MGEGQSHDKRDKDKIRRATPPPRKRRYKAVLIAILMTGAAGGLGYLSFKLWQENKALEKKAWADDLCEKNLKDAQGQVATANQDVATCKTQRDNDKTEYAAIDKDLERMQKNLAASADELENLRKQRAQVEKRLEAFRKLSEKLKAMIDSGQLDVVVRKGRMIVEMPSEVMFPSGSADLSDDGKMALMKVAVILEQFPDRQFMIAGHTDNRPLKQSKYGSNWELSTARAVTVTEFLVQAGLKAQNLVAAGYGEFDPVASNKDAKGRQKNRRIEIILMPSIEELPTLPDDSKASDKGGDQKPDGK